MYLLYCKSKGVYRAFLLFILIASLLQNYNQQFLLFGGDFAIGVGNVDNRFVQIFSSNKIPSPCEQMEMRDAKTQNEVCCNNWWHRVVSIFERQIAQAQDIRDICSVLFWVNGVGALLIQRQDNAVRTYSGVSAPSQMLEQTPKVCPWPLPGAQMFR